MIFKKGLIIVFSVILLVGLVGCGNISGGDKVSETGSNNFGAAGQPQRKAEVYGKVKSIQGNLFTINEMEQTATGQDLSDKDKAKRREEMQNLSPEERKKKLDAEQKVTGETIRVNIPVGVPIKTKKDQNPDSLFEDGNMSDIKVGMIVTIWTENQQKENSTAEYVKYVNR